MSTDSIDDVTDMTQSNPKLLRALEALKTIQTSSHDSNIHKLSQQAITNINDVVDQSIQAEKETELLRSTGETLIQIMRGLGNSAEVNLGITKIHEGIMWAIKHSRKDQLNA